MRQVLASGGTPYISAAASAGVRLCQAATRAGIDLTGAQIGIGGEPITASRLRAIHDAGAECVSFYSSAETGSIAYGCSRADYTDEVHLFHDLWALIQPGAGNDSDSVFPPNALLITSLSPRPRLTLLNASLGDAGTLTTRDCGCALHELGWTTHLHTIRSYEKLTAGGMTFLGADVVSVLEDVLPARFGGGPTDYQLIEDESPEGEPLIRLLVHPRLGPLDEQEVARALLAAIGHGSGAQRVMGLMWREAGLVRVERTEPHVNYAGKVLHLAQARTADRPTQGT
jgi:hypothetical protein